jgi:hypothetical protein
MKTSYIFLAFVAILGWNAFLIHRDAELFKAYDTCAHYTNHPDCPYHQK